MDERKWFVDEEEIPPLRVQREGSSAVAFIRTLFDPETTGTANAVLGTMTIPPGQSEPMVPHAHSEYEESEYVVKGEGYLLLGPSRKELKRYELRPERAFFVPPGWPHCIANTGSGEMKIAFSFYPAWVKGRTYREIATELTDVKRST
jgi:oxalate decarboxylase/phosphoglucose isomerase-like protein (cupin superfamily)